MAGAIGIGCGGDAAARNDVEPLVDQLGGELRRGAGIIGVVAIDQDINIGLDIGEHAAHDIAFALTRLGADDGASLAGARHRLVFGIVVVDDRCRHSAGSRGNRAPRSQWRHLHCSRE